MEASWSSEELRNGFLPDDFHHLWSILCINPENRVKMSSVKTDLKMIRNILPEEVYHIYNEVYKLLEQKQDSKCALNDYNDLYKNMALNYLKYGLAGIEVKNNRYCVNCGQDEKTNTTSICNIGNSKGHKIKCFHSAHFMVMTCEDCGLHRKFDTASNNDISLFGPCYTNKSTHMFHSCRSLYCPIEE